MTRKPLSIHQGQMNNPFQSVWWKPLVAAQKDMVRTLKDSVTGTPLESMLSAQEDLFEKLEDNVSNIFGEAFNNRQMFTPWLLGDHTEPYIDIIEGKNAYKIKAELPGVKEDDINIQSVEGGIQIEGEKYQESAEKGENYSHQECHTGYFSRVIALPEDADLEKAKTHFNLNILTIEVPRKAEKNISREPKLKISIVESSAPAKSKTTAPKTAVRAKAPASTPAEAAAPKTAVEKPAEKHAEPDSKKPEHSAVKGDSEQNKQKEKDQASGKKNVA